MCTEYNKLVRDNIPNIILDSGRQCSTEVMQLDEFIQALRSKLVEEAQEIYIAPVEKLVDELADLYEVIDCIVSVYGINKSFIFEKQEQKRAERGGYEKRIRLTWVE